MTISKKKKKVINLPAPKPLKRKWGRGEIEFFDRNPFISEWEIRYKERGFTIAKADYGYLINDDGELEIEVADGKFVSVIPVDSEEFTKIFVKKIGDFDKLSKPAMKVFLCLLYILPNQAMGRDTIKYTFHDALKAAKKQNITQLSNQTFRRGIRELIEKKFLARTDTTDVYWINPTRFFAGNRLTFAEMYIKKDVLPELEAKIKEHIKEEFPIPEKATK